MDLVLLKDFLSDYSLPTVVIALFTGALSFIGEKLLKEKLPKAVKIYAPFLLSVLLYFAYDAIFVNKAFSLNSEAFYAGLLSGSLSKVLYSAAKRISNGKNAGLSATVLLIESLLSEYVEEEKLSAAVGAITELLLNSERSPDVGNEILSVIKEGSVKEFSDEELLLLVAIIIKSVESLKI